MLDTVPDLRRKLRNGAPEELADIFEAFDVSATYDKRDGKLHLAASVTAELVAKNEKPRAPVEASGNSYIAVGDMNTYPPPRSGSQRRGSCRGNHERPTAPLWRTGPGSGAATQGVAPPARHCSAAAPLAPGAGAEEIRHGDLLAGWAARSFRTGVAPERFVG
jgi:hypothetical protein